MDFRFSEEQEQLRRTVREFAEGEIRPRVMEWDEPAQFPSELLPKLAQLDLLGITISEKYGGAGLGYLEWAIVLAELARVDTSVAIIVAAHVGLCSSHIYRFGSEEQKQKYLVPLARGEKLGCWSLTEPGAGSDAASMHTRAVRQGSSWIVNGSKAFTTNGHYADVCVVMASTDPGKGHRGISAFIVEKGTPGFRAGKKENKLGIRASDTAEMILEECRVPAENLLGREGEGFANCLSILDGGRISLAAVSLGIAQGAFEVSLQYAQERKQFGKSLAEFQAIQWKLADMKTEIEAARWLTYAAAEKADRGVLDTKLCSMAKLYASEAAVQAAGEAVQIHGGYGFVKDYPAEKYYRDVKLCTIGEGTSEIQRLVIARQLLGKSH
ncbi:MAG: acyl-CoA dehydrogenase [Acidobacteria bacterium]|nr:acyl-CoA dehydrogenase [Acidobacteriota bacterium]